MNARTLALVGFAVLLVSSRETTLEPRPPKLPKPLGKAPSSTAVGADVDSTPTPIGTLKASPELEPRHGPTPAGYSPDLARARAPELAAHLARRGPRAYSRELVAQWQKLAALHADGVYAGSTRGALVAYGVDNPPRPFAAPFATLPYHQPDLDP